MKDRRGICCTATPEKQGPVKTEVKRRSQRQRHDGFYIPRRGNNVLLIPTAANPASEPHSARATRLVQRPRPWKLAGYDIDIQLHRRTGSWLRLCQHQAEDRCTRSEPCLSERTRTGPGKGDGTVRNCVGRTSCGCGVDSPWAPRWVGCVGLRFEAA